MAHLIIFLDGKHSLEINILSARSDSPLRCILSSFAFQHLLKHYHAPNYKTNNLHKNKNRSRPLEPSYVIIFNN